MSKQKRVDERAEKAAIAPTPPPNATRLPNASATANGNTVSGSDAPKEFLNRDLSWLEFNRRVLNEALDDRTPLLERVRFLGIFTSNLDEYFMKRVGGLKRQLAAGVVAHSLTDSRPPKPWQPFATRCCRCSPSRPTAIAASFVRSSRPREFICSTGRT